MSIKQNHIAEKNLLFREKLIIFVVFFSIFLLYVFTLAPNISTGDSSEFILSAYLLGVSHSPGYPLFNLLGKLFSMIPIGGIAWRINLSSAIFNLLASVFVYLTLYKLLKYWPSAILAAIFYAISPIIWEYSVKTEVFALNNLFAASILYLIVCSSLQPNSQKLLYITLFVCGLALTNHHTIILFAPAVILGLYFYQKENLIKPKAVLIAFFLFVLGLAVYLYVPIRAHAQPYLNWDDARTFHGLIQLISRADFGSLNLSVIRGGEVLSTLDKFSLYLSSLLKQFNPLGILLSLFGVFFLIKQKEWRLSIIFILTFLLSSFVFIAMATLLQHDLIFMSMFERFYMLPSVLMAIFIGFGIYYLHVVFYFDRKHLINAVTAGVIIIAIGINFPSVSQRHINLVYHHGYNLLNSFGKNAIFLVSGDGMADSLAYIQQVDGIRPDVIVLDQALLSYHWYRQQMNQRYPTLKIPLEKDASMAQFLALNIDTHPIYINVINNVQYASLATDYQLQPVGLVGQIVKKYSSLNTEKYLSDTERIWKTYNLTDLTHAYKKNTLEESIVHDYASAHFNRGLSYQGLGLFDLAIHEYDDAIRLNPAFANPYKNVGFIYANIKKQPNQAVPYWRVYVKLNPLDGDDTAILSFLDRYQ